ncbi:hypothetical protein Agabi119p4_4875 [Agaricus bisporus var. burnettii]|uniref:Uncharacterized protein n=1 Tax=Agaricus bisporus var. burnettii TaxID=192524 RepID=A0A8H7F442_AGABI|nr:hypothetical protein Agabi119p4_4875 [Agaricus bisporus var. burnettii]
MKADEEAFRQIVENDQVKLEYKQLYEQDTASLEELEAYYLPSFKQLALKISGRDDIPKPPATTYSICFYVLCERNDARSKRALIDYIRTEADKLYKQEFESRTAFALEAAWKEKYVGDSDELLKTAMVAMLKRYFEPFQNFCSIIQGSGAGKSRLVDKIAESVFTIPIVLRPVEDKLGFPPGDTAKGEDLVDYFCNQSGTDFRVQRRYVQFLLKSLAFADKWIDDFIKEGRAIANVAAAWRKYLGPPRSAQRNAMYAQAIDDSPLEKFENLFHWNISIDELQGQVRDFVDVIAQKIKPTIEGKPIKGEPVIVFYFDEAQYLTQSTVTKQGEGPRRTAYQCLCKAFTYLVYTPVFGLFISAYSGLVEHPPIVRHSWSSRLTTTTAREHDDKLHAPFVELPFDTWKESYLVSEGEHSGDELCSLRFMARFGRPMFWAVLESNGADENDVMRLAMSKLELHLDPSSDRVLECPFRALVPLLAARVDLSFDSSRDEAVLLERHLVTSGMRTAFSIPQHRQYIHGGYPSEPFLAEAAARALLKHFRADTIREGNAITDINKIIAKYKDLVPSAISAWIQKGLIDEKSKEDLVARLFCSLAHDISILAKLLSSGIEKNTLDDRVSFSQMVPVLGFLRALIATEHVEKILKAKPSNMSGTTLEEAFKHSFVHFTQFVKVGDASSITNEGAYFLFTRGAAMQGHGDMADAGLVIPVWIRGDDNPHRWCMSAIFIQMKNWLYEEVTFVNAENEYSFFSPSDVKEYQERPYISITMEFPMGGSREEFPPDEVNVTSYKADEESQSNDTHPRYEIFIRGCSKQVYNVVGDVSYSDILVPENIMKEHPRGGAFLDAAMRMKPYWETGSYDWATMSDTERISTPVDDLGPEEGVRKSVPGEEK